MPAFNLREFIQRRARDFDQTELGALLPNLLLGVHGPWLAGGLLRRAAMERSLEKSDVDLFFRDQAQLDEYELRFKNDPERWELVKATEHHRHYRGFFKLGDGKPRDVQLINFAFYTSLEDVINSFDFTICQFATDGERLVLGDFTLWDTARKHVVLHKLTYPVSTMRRTLKYQRQGYTICTGTIAEILARTRSMENPNLDEIAYVD